MDHFQILEIEEIEIVFETISKITFRFGKTISGQLLASLNRELSFGQMISRRKKKMFNQNDFIVINKIYLLSL